MITVEESARSPPVDHQKKIVEENIASAIVIRDILEIWITMQYIVEDVEEKT